MIFEKKLMQKTSSLINSAELSQAMRKENTVLIDARSGPDVRQRYAKEHLLGAIFVNLEDELSQKTGSASNGGRHPLPTIEKFASFIGQKGIDPSTHVIVYDDKNGANAAARFWWMMKALGHEKIQVLNGGMQAAIEAGIELSDQTPIPPTRPAYPADEWKLSVVNAEQVAHAVTDPDQLVIDVREGSRYRGESEPIDTVAGHIPGAVNVPYSQNLDADGRFLPAGQLADKYKEIFADCDPGQVIVHCGSGVTACHTLLAIEEAGFAIPNLYVGSWSEWSGNDRPVARGEE